MEKRVYRPFQISCGLREGYAQSSTVHTIEEAQTVVRQWIERRLNGGKKIVAGMITEGEFLYPMIEGGVISSQHEPAFRYQGVVREDANDDEAIEMLHDLAQELSAKLGQKRVHAAFGNTYFVVEQQ
jgi:hypothetical protein